ncbi:flagellar/basal body protein, partial [Haematococcus lacustris]
MFYLEDVELARHLVELGLNKKPKKLASQGKNVEEFPLLQALKDREEAVRNGKLTTIIFIRDRNAKAQEVSGYIDYGHRHVLD